MNFQLIKTIYALNPIIGSIDNPTKYGVGTNNGEGLFRLLNNLFQLAGLIAGLFVIFQIISAGYMYLSASGDPKKFEQAWNKIWQALLGLVVVAAAFTVAAVVGKITGIDPLNPTLYAP